MHMRNSAMSVKKPVSPEQKARNLAVGARIKLIREQNGYTQEEFGPKVGLSPGACVQWEKGWALPSIKTIEKISKKFGASTEWLMTGDEPDEALRAHTTTERDALSLIRALPMNEHQEVLDYLRWRASKHTK